jgi:hypothetical protein
VGPQALLPGFREVKDAPVKSPPLTGQVVSSAERPRRPGGVTRLRGIGVGAGPVRGVSRMGSPLRQFLEEPRVGDAPCQPRRAQPAASSMSNWGQIAGMGRAHSFARPNRACGCQELQAGNLATAQRVPPGRRTGLGQVSGGARFHTILLAGGNRGEPLWRTGELGAHGGKGGHTPMLGRRHLARLAPTHFVPWSPQAETRGAGFGVQGRLSGAS